jgi:hypothetical protein
MLNPIILVQPHLATAPPKAKPFDLPPDVIWMGVAGILAIMTVGAGAYSYFQMNKLAKKLRMEEFKTKELQKKLKLALETIRKMETNPDLVHSREFNLDYLRMRMAEEVFHFAIVNQIKVKVKDKITVALRPNQAQQAAIGIASTTGRQVDEVFDVEYQTVENGKTKKGVLFRIQIRLMKLPTQATSITINQIIDCIETFLSPSDEQDNWQPTIQGRVAHMEWDQKAKPTPLLVIEQSNEGVNVSFATKRQALIPNPSNQQLPPPPAPRRAAIASNLNSGMTTTQPTGGSRRPPQPTAGKTAQPTPSKQDGNLTSGMAAIPKAPTRRPTANPVKKTAS